MTSFVPKIIGVILALVLLILAPMVCKSNIDEIAIERTTWNALEMYVDIIADKGQLTVSDYTDFVKRVSSKGLAFNITITTSIRRAFPSGADGFEIKYIDNSVIRSIEGGVTTLTKFGKGDIVSVEIEAINKTRAQRINQLLFNITTPFKNMKLSKMIRNMG